MTVTYQWGLADGCGPCNDEQSRAEENRTEQNRPDQNRPEQNRPDQNRTGWNFLIGLDACEARGPEALPSFQLVM